MKSIIPTPETIARQVVLVLTTAVIVAVILNQAPSLKKLLDDESVGGVL